jgi:hypothetical protein
MSQNYSKSKIVFIVLVFLLALIYVIFRLDFGRLGTVLVQLGLTIIYSLLCINWKLKKFQFDAYLLISLALLLIQTVNWINSL